MRRSAVAAVLLPAVLVAAGVGVALTVTSGDGGRRPAPLTPTPTPVVISSMAALGDSISRGTDACGQLADCTKVSWATGTAPEVDSHYQRLLAINPAIEGQAHNDAKAGADIADLPGQVAAAVAQQVDYVTVLMGANDACAPTLDQMTPVDQFRETATRSMDSLREGLPDATVLVASIPDISNLLTAVGTLPDADLVWSLGHVCPTMLAAPTSAAPADARRRDGVRERLVAYNTVLGEVCATNPRCRYDGGAVFRHRFSAAEVSTLDYFHPSPAGQAVLAKVTWDAAWGGSAGRPGSPPAEGATVAAAPGPPALGDSPSAAGDSPPAADDTTPAASAAADVTPPTVTIQPPGATASRGATTTLRIKASDDVAVTGVTVSAGGRDLGPAVAAAHGIWVFTADTSGITPGNYAVTAIAVDAAGNRSVSRPVTVTVGND